MKINRDVLITVLLFLIVLLIGIWIGILFGSFIEINHYGDIIFPEG